MSAPAAISASLVDVRNVSSHKCVRLEIHVPAEQAAAVMAAFGWPTMVEPVPVAIARLVENPKAEPEHKERRAFTGLPYAQQAAMRCQEPTYWEFLAANSSSRFWSEMVAKYQSEASAAAAMVRQRCGVESRADITTNGRSGKDWMALEAEYYAWQRGRR